MYNYMYITIGKVHFLYTIAQVTWHAYTLGWGLKRNPGNVKLLLRHIWSYSLVPSIFENQWCRKNIGFFCQSIKIKIKKKHVPKFARRGKEKAIEVMVPGAQK